ncbi:MAG: hypothetical protein ACM3JH_14635 [Acidithiobacillales bacterium]
MINEKPESLSLDYDEATSFWPGRLTIKNLRIRGSDQNVQWIIRLDAARVDYSVFALARRTFRAKRLRGTGLSFFLRNKLTPAEAKAANVSALPEVPGFADPPLRSPEIRGPEQPGNPWRIDVRSISVDRFDEIWIDAFHYRGVARLEGGFFLRPGLLARIGPARVTVESGETRIGRAPVSVAVSGTVSAAFEPYEPSRVHGSEVWRKIWGEVKLDVGFDRLQALEHLVRTGSGTRLEDGAGKGTIRGTVERGVAKGEVRFAIAEGSVRRNDLKLQGDADLRLLIPRWNLTSGPLDVSGSRLALSDVRSSGSDESRRWWGRFDITSGKIGSRTSAGIQARSRDARPLLALFTPDLPAWTRGLLDLEDFAATATIEIAPSLTSVRDLDARGGSYRIRGHYLRRNANRDGAFLIQSGALSVGLELDRNATKLRLLGAKQWFEQQAADGPNTTPPAADGAAVRPSVSRRPTPPPGPAAGASVHARGKPIRDFRTPESVSARSLAGPRPGRNPAGS